MDHRDAPPTTGPEPTHRQVLDAVHHELARLEQLLHLPDDRHGPRPSRLPAWRRETAGEHRWAAATAVVVAIALQIVLPDQLTLSSRWLLPGLELAALVALALAGPSRLDRESRLLRTGSLVLVGLLSLANAWSASLLVLGIVAGRIGGAGPLLSSGASIWLTNIIAFAVWYWELDRGGPVARAHARQTSPDFLFVQMQNPTAENLEWEPQFLDYLYLSFTNATAFSPTDVMPLSRWAKMLMLLQALVSLVTVALVIARAVNVLGQ